MRRRVHDAPAVAAVLALVGAAFGQLLGHRLLAGYDVTTYSLPNRAEVTWALRHLHLPQWDPLRFAGSPLLANPQAAVLYPLHWPLLVLAPDRAQDVALVLHVAIAAVGAYAFARLALRTSPLAAVVAGAGFGLSGFVEAHIGHFEQTTSLAWLPWALLATDRLAIAEDLRRAARPVAGLAAALALTALAGHTQYLHLAIATVLVYALIVARPFASAARALAGVALGVALAAIQLVPTELLSRRSVRSGGLSFHDAVAYSLPRSRALTAFLPDFTRAPHAGVEYVAGLPWAVLALAAIAVATGRAGRRGVALAAIAVLGLVLALGSGTPVFRLAYDIVPAMDSFRVPARWLLVPSLALPLLAACGLDAVTHGLRPHRAALATVTAGAGVVGVAGLALGRAAPEPVSIALGAVAAALAAGGWYLAKRTGRAGPFVALALVLVVGGELLGANAHAYVRSLRVPAGALLARSSTAAALSDPTAGRIFSVTTDAVPLPYGEQRRVLPPNTFVLDHLRSIDGYDGGLLVDRNWVRAMTGLSRNRTFRDDSPLVANLGPTLDPRRFAELDVTRVLVHDWPADIPTLLPPGSRRIARAGDVDVWSTPTYGPVFLAGSGDVPAGLRLLRDPRRPERLVVLVPPAAGGRRVVVSESYAPGWSASRGVRLTRHHDLLMSFVAPAGGGRVVLRYRTPGLVAGATITMVALLVLGALLAVPRRTGPHLTSGRS